MKSTFLRAGKPISSIYNYLLTNSGPTLSGTICLPYRHATSGTPTTHFKVHTSVEWQRTLSHSVNIKDRVYKRPGGTTSYTRPRGWRWCPGPNSGYLAFLQSKCSLNIWGRGQEVAAPASTISPNKAPVKSTAEVTRCRFLTSSPVWETENNYSIRVRLWLKKHTQSYYFCLLCGTISSCFNKSLKGRFNCLSIVSWPTPRGKLHFNPQIIQSFADPPLHCPFSFSSTL